MIIVVVIVRILDPVMVLPEIGLRGYDNFWQLPRFWWVVHAWFDCTSTRRAGVLVRVLVLESYDCDILEYALEHSRILVRIPAKIHWTTGYISAGMLVVVASLWRVAHAMAPRNK